MNLKGDRIAAYARFSSDKQSDASIDDQLRRLKTFVGAQGKAIDDRLTFTTTRSRARAPIARASKL